MVEFNTFVFYENGYDSLVQKVTSKRDTYIRNLEKWYWWTYLQGSNIDTDTETRLWMQRGPERMGQIERITLKHRQCLCSVTQLCPTLCNPMAVAHQAPLSMGFSRLEHWSGLPCPSLWDLPNPGIEPRSPALQADSLPPEPPGKPKNPGVGSLSLLQGIFLTQDSN